jgi:hypothetical protein
MAGPLAAVERFFERIFERPPARLFAPHLEREYLQRQLLRTVEADRVVRGRRTYVPTSYRVRLNPANLLELQAQSTLTSELAEALRGYALSRGYVLANRPLITLERHDEIEPGEVAVISEAVALPPPRVDGRRRLSAPASGVNAAPPNGEAASIDPGHTAAFEAPRPNTPRATIAVHVPGRSPWRVGISSGRLRVGRARDNDLVLPDDRVSRHHGQISVRFGTLVYADLGSTNGSFVNGSRVTEIALGPTDVLQLGGSSLTVEPGQ